MWKFCLPFLAATLIAGSAWAQEVDPSCEIGAAEIGDRDACSPIVACFESYGVYFTGRAIGWNEGTLAGKTSDGAVCTGNWMSRNALGLGQATFACDDGTMGTAFFTYQDSLTGTATGHGLTDRLGRVRVWSGHNIRQFVINETGAIDPLLMCGDHAIPIS
jgi:hypothetical protein